MPLDVEVLFSELVRLETEVWSAVDERLTAEHELPLTWFEPLRVVQQVPGCRLSDIVDALGISVGGASKLVDRLQAAGLCERVTDPTDRRSPVINLTSQGTRVVQNARRTFRRELRRLLVDKVDEQALEVLLATVSSLRSQFVGRPNPQTAGTPT